MQTDRPIATDPAKAPAPPAHYYTWLIAILIVGALVRLGISAVSRGSDDAILWEMFAKDVREHGLLETYRLESQVNHPPLPVLWSRLALEAGRGFPFVMKLPAILADLGSILLLAHLWRERSGWIRGLLAAVTYALSPVAILVSGYHCNDDCAYAFLSLLSAYLITDRRAFFFGGLALGAAINVKLIPVILLPAGFALCHNRRDVIRLILGLGITAIPFIPLLSVPDAMWKNMIRYAPNPDHWGIPFFLWEYPRGLHAYRSIGRWLIMAAAVLLCSTTWGWRRWNAYELMLTIYAAFLVFSPGFGVQYTVSLMPLLAAVSLRRAWLYNILAGSFLLLVYWSYLSAWKIPLESKFSSEGFPVPAALFGIMAWWELVKAVVHLIRRHEPTWISSL